MPIGIYKRPSLQDRFWSKVIKTKSCWNWIGTIQRGYGIFYIDAKNPVRAHRYSYELNIGEIPKGLLVCHKCDNPRCINPKHLFIGTIADNNLDCKNKGRLIRPPNQTGSNHSQHILTEKDVLNIRDAYKNGFKQKDLAILYGVAKNTIHKVCKYKTWNHI